jgi:hypothetical protein
LKDTKEALKPVIKDSPVSKERYVRYLTHLYVRYLRTIFNAFVRTIFNASVRTYTCTLYLIERYGKSVETRHPVVTIYRDRYDAKCVYVRLYVHLYIYVRIYVHDCKNVCMYMNLVIQWLPFTERGTIFNAYVYMFMIIYAYM